MTQLVDTLLQKDDTGEETIRLEEAMDEATQENPIVSSMLLLRLFPVFRKVLLEMDRTDVSMSMLSKIDNGGGGHTNHSHATAETPAIVIFCKLLRAFCCVEHPVVLLLDDWQWLDTKSLELLKTLGSMGNIPGLMILGTCRGNEVGFQDPLSVLLRTLEKEQHIRITDIQVSSLSIEGVQDVTANLLQLPSDHDPSKLRSLAELIHQLTGGSPFFVEQNLRALCEANLIYYSNGEVNWDSKIAIHDHFELERNRILDAAIQKLADISQAVRDTLVIASFLGARFSLRHLDLVARSDSESIQNALDHLVQEDVLYHDTRKDYYRWTHDRFQLAGYSLVRKHEQKQMSVQIGRQLLSNLPPTELEEEAFLVANLFLQGFDVIVDPDERIRVASLLHLAGTKAGTSSAFDSAAAYFSRGIALLNSHPWQNDYDVCLALHNGAIEMEYCVGQFERSDELFEMMLHNTRSLEDQMRAYEAKISSLSARHKDAEALRVGFKLLKELGEPFPKRVTMAHSMVAIGKCVLWLRQNSTDSILKAEPMQRWDKLAALRILQMIGPALIRSKAEFSPLWAVRSVLITTRHGLSSMSPPVFLALGMILGTAIVALPDDCKRCSEISRRLEDRYEAPEWNCRMLVFGSYDKWWHDPYTSATGLLPHISGIKAGLMSGDVELAFVHSAFYSTYAFTTGAPLKDHIIAMEDQYNHFSKLEQKMVFVQLSLELAKRLTSNATDISGAAKEFGIFCYRATKQAEQESGMQDPSLLIISYFNQLLLCVFTNDFVEGLRVWKKLRRLPIDGVYGPNLTVQIYYYFGMLEIMAAQATQSWIRKYGAAKRSLKWLRALERKMTCTENILNKIYHLEAERGHLSGNQQHAKRNFQLSIQYAKQSDYLHDEALTHERLAFAFDQWGG